MEGGHYTINEILSFLKKIYCSTIGVEYMHIADQLKKVLRAFEKKKIN